MNEHKLKTINPYFSEVYLGLKTFELRKNDRDFKVGDWLTLQEYFAQTDSYGTEITKVITSILTDVPEYGLMNGYCIISFRDLK